MLFLCCAYGHNTARSRHLSFQRLSRPAPDSLRQPPAPLSLASLGEHKPETLSAHQAELCHGNTKAVSKDCLQLKLKQSDEFIGEAAFPWPHLKRWHPNPFLFSQAHPVLCTVCALPPFGDSRAKWSPEEAEEGTAPEEAWR